MMEQKNNNKQMPIETTSAAIAANPLLPAALSVEQGNRIIAEFVGIVIVKRNNEDAVFMFENAAFPEYFRCTKYNTYNSDWNLLMNVVEKVHIDKKVKEVSIRPGQTRIWLKEFSYIQSPCLPENNSITECWLAVIKFIIWHNQQGVSEGSR